MLSVVCWKWTPPQGYRTRFEASHVNILANMVDRHYSKPHQVVCVTDDWRGLRSDIAVVPIWDDFAHLTSPHGGVSPSCYRRLRAFAPDAAEWFGERFVSIDLDMVIMDDLTPLWDRPEDFVIWEGTATGTPYNGSMWLLRSGTRPQVWTGFDPERTPAMTFKRGLHGSDQAWLAHVIPGEPTWTAESDKVYSFHRHIRRNSGQLPRGGARIVSFAGNYDPWDPAIRANYNWVMDHYH